MSDIRRIKDKNEIRGLVNINDPNGRTKIVNILARSGAIFEGHFGWGETHASHLLRFNHIGRMDGGESCEYLAARLVEEAGINADDKPAPKILCPESAGFFLGHAVAKFLREDGEDKSANLAIARLDDHRLPDLHLRLGKVNPGDRVVVVNDVDRTGESLDRLIKLARRSGATVDTAMVFAVWSDGDFLRRMIDLGVKPYRLVEFNGSIYYENYCPLCERGIGLLPANEFN